MTPALAGCYAGRRDMQRWEALSRFGQLLVLVVILAGCGPIEYVNQVTRQASSEVAAARSVQADKHAPYWYTLAVEYLHKAREEAAAADFQAANRFGRRSAKAARKARSVAIERARDPEARPEPVPADDDVIVDEIEILDPGSEEADNPLEQEQTDKDKP